MVLRIHSSKRKEGHEQHYAELQLFTPWRNEIEELKRNHPEQCMALYYQKEKEIEEIRKEIYPGEETITLLENCDLEEIMPQSILDGIDAQGEQELEDGKEEGLVDDPRYAGLQYEGDPEKGGESNYTEEFKYKKLIAPEQEELDFLTGLLVQEQRAILNKVIHYAMEVVKARNSPHEQPVPIRLIVVGGAGNLNIQHDFCSTILKLVSI